MYHSERRQMIGLYAAMLNLQCLFVIKLLMKNVSDQEDQKDEMKDYGMVHMRQKKVGAINEQSRDCRSAQHTQQKVCRILEIENERKLEQGLSINSSKKQRDHNRLSNHTQDNRNEINITHNHPNKKQVKVDSQQQKFIKQEVPSTDLNNISLKQNKREIKYGNRQQSMFNQSNSFQRQQKSTRHRALVMQMDRNQIMHYLLSTVQRNQAYKCNYLHFLLPHALVLLALHTLSRDKNAYYMKIYNFLLKKLNNQEVRDQMSSNQSFDQYFHYLLKYQDAEYDKVLTLLTKFLKEEGEEAGRICPYYYNFFAFFANSRTLFGGNVNVQLVQYTIKYQYRYYNHNFTQEDVKREIDRLEKEMTASYRSREI